MTDTNAYTVHLTVCIGNSYPSACRYVTHRSLMPQFKVNILVETCQRIILFAMSLVRLKFLTRINQRTMHSRSSYAWAIP